MIRVSFLIFSLITPLLAQSGPKVSTPTSNYKTRLQQIRERPNPPQTTGVTRASNQQKNTVAPGNYPWKLHITTSVFWIGERPTKNNPTPNHASSWDTQWQKNYGGYDNPHPSARHGDYRPKQFIPRQNPFYIALPYNDLVNHTKHKPEASRVIPWFRHFPVTPGKSVCHGRWLEIHRNGKSCFAQWEDCGPFHTDDWRYVFGNAKPKNRKNHSAGLDISPAVRDFLKINPGDKVHWRFVEFNKVPYGPWSQFGANNPFVNKAAHQGLRAAKAYQKWKKKQHTRKRNHIGNL